MNYPNGKKFDSSLIKPKTEKKKYVILDNASNRGMLLEEDIIDSSNYYNDLGLCLIYKRPTPIKVVRMDKTNKSKISEAYFSEKSTTDFNGIYKGRYLDFEAKETINKTSFSFHNIRENQIEHLLKVEKLGGIGFFIIRMKALNETYLIKFKDIYEFSLNNNRLSIPYSYLKEKGYIIEEGYHPRLKYLDAVDKAFNL